MKRRISHKNHINIIFAKKCRKMRMQLDSDFQSLQKTFENNYPSLSFASIDAPASINILTDSGLPLTRMMDS